MYIYTYILASLISRIRNIVSHVLYYTLNQKLITRSAWKFAAINISSQAVNWCQNHHPKLADQKRAIFSIDSSFSKRSAINRFIKIRAILGKTQPCIFFARSTRKITRQTKSRVALSLFLSFSPDEYFPLFFFPFWFLPFFSFLSFFFVVLSPDKSQLRSQITRHERNLHGDGAQELIRDRFLR